MPVESCVMLRLPTKPDSHVTVTRTQGKRDLQEVQLHTTNAVNNDDKIEHKTSKERHYVPRVVINRCWKVNGRWNKADLT